jgi:hypothetical protein
MPPYKEDVANLVEGSSIYILTFGTECTYKFSSSARSEVKAVEPSTITLQPRSLLIVGPDTLKRLEVYLPGNGGASPKKNDTPRVLLMFKSVKEKL